MQQPLFEGKTASFWKGSAQFQEYMKKLRTSRVVNSALKEETGERIKKVRAPVFSYGKNKKE